MASRDGSVLLLAAVGLFASGCGRVGYERLSGHSPDASGLDASGLDAAHRDAPGMDGSSTDPDGAPDASPHGDCLPWPSTPRFSEAEALSALNSAAMDQQPHLSSDGLTLYFASPRSGVWNIYVSNRPSDGHPFGEPQLAELSDPERKEVSFATTADELTAFVSAAENDDADLYWTQRDSPGEPFGPLRHIPELSTSFDDYDPFVVGGGRRLYYVITDWDLGEGGQEIVRATRSEADERFSAPEAVSELNSPSNEDNPSLTSDERLIVFSSDRGDSHDLFYATRPERGAGFSTPRPLEDLNTSFDESEAFVAPDGCTVYFSSDRPGGAGELDLYRAGLLED